MEQAPDLKWPFMHMFAHILHLWADVTLFTRSTFSTGLFPFMGRLTIYCLRGALV